MDSKRFLPIGDPASIVNQNLFDVVFFDCDGVLYQSNHVLPGAIETISALQAKNVHVKFVTNSSTKSREQLQAKLTQMGFTGISADDCYPSGLATAQYLKARGCKRVYVIGEEGLMQELQKAGIEALGGPQDSSKTMRDNMFIDLGNSPTAYTGIDAVVVGYDQDFNYYKLASASLCFQKNDDCILVGTNDDQHDRIGGRWLIPVNGCALSAVTHAVNNLDGPHKCVKPIIVGKPSSLLGDLVLARSGLADVPRDRILMVGDKVETDIALAKNCGFKSCLLLSGCVTRADLDRMGDTPADFVFNGICDIADSLGL
jgi:phosphoglycolate phosphatase